MSIYYDEQNGKTTSKPKRKNISFGTNPDPDVLSAHGFWPTINDQPGYDPTYQKLIDNGWLSDGGGYVRQWAVEERDIEDVRAEKRAQMAAAKNAARDAGFEIDGVLWDSDYHARIAYAEVAQIIASDPTYTAAWKASEGVWVTMDAATLATVQSAGRAHIESCFATYAARLAEIDAATTPEAVAAIVW